jgi:hypothetical protein
MTLGSFVDPRATQATAVTYLQCLTCEVGFATGVTDEGWPGLSVCGLYVVPEYTFTFEGSATSLADTGQTRVDRGLVLGEFVWDYCFKLTFL